MSGDVFKILKDLELKAVGLDEATSKMQEGYFVAFRDIGLPIREDTFANPWDPQGGNLQKGAPPVPDKTDPANTPATGSGGVDPEKVYDDTMLANIAKSQRNYINTFMLTDSKLNMNANYSVMPAASKVSDTWWAIITGANGVPSTLQLSPELKAEYDAATAVLMDANGDPTKHYEQYLEYREKHQDKVKARDKAYAAAFTDPKKLQRWPNDGKPYQDDVDLAMDEWESFGHKHEIENAQDILAAQGTDPAIALISRAKKKFNDNVFTFPGVGLIPWTSMLPENWYDANDDDGWTQYTSHDFHSETHYTSSSTSFGGGGGFSVGFWSVGGGFDHSHQRTDMSISTTNLEISFDYAVVDVVRPWMDTSLLNLDNWFLFGDYPAGTISDGSFAQEKPPDGKEHAFLPSVVTSLILLRNLRIKWDDWKNQWDSDTTHTDANVSVGYGPFAVSGHYGSDSHSFDASSDDEGEGLAIDGIQLIGYVSQINPKCPQKNGKDFLQ